MGEFDVIIGHDLICQLQLNILFSSKNPCIAYQSKQVEMKPPGYWTRDKLEEKEQLHMVCSWTRTSLEEEIFLYKDFDAIFSDC